MNGSEQDSTATMNKESHAFVWNSVSAFGYLGLHALSIVCIARLAGVEAVGIYLLAQAIGFPLSRIGGLNYHDINATEPTISRLREHVLNVTLVAVPLSLASVGAWVAVTEGSLREAGPPLLVANALLAYAQIAQGRFIRLHQYRIAAHYELLRGACAVACIVTGVVWFGSLAAAGYLLVMAWFGVGCLELLQARHVSATAGPVPSLSPSDALSLRERLRYAICDSTMSLQGSSVRVMVGGLLGEAAVGVFGATALLVRFIQPAAAALSKTFMPQLVDGLSRRDPNILGQHFSMVNRLTLAMSVTLAAAGYWLTPTLIEALLGSALRPPALVAAIIMFGAAPLVGSRFQTQILTALRQRRPVEQASWSALFSSLLLAPPLILSYQLTGAAVCLALSFFIRYAVAARHVQLAIRDHGQSLAPQAMAKSIDTPACRT